MIKEFEAYEMLKSLGNYLKTELTITSGSIIYKFLIAGRPSSKECEGHSISVNIRNTAPMETNWPLVVFTGVGLVINFAHYDHNFKHLKDAQNLRVDLTNAPQSNPFIIKGSERVDGADYPAITSDEERRGHILFPGCSLIYEFSLTAKKCPDVNRLKFWVEANVSRRHLLHFRKELAPN